MFISTYEWWKKWIIEQIFHNNTFQYSQVLSMPRVDGRWHLTHIEGVHFSLTSKYIPTLALLQYNCKIFCKDKSILETHLCSWSIPTSKHSFSILTVTYHFEVLILLNLTLNWSNGSLLFQSELWFNSVQNTRLISWLGLLKYAKNSLAQLTKADCIGPFHLNISGLTTFRKCRLLASNPTADWKLIHHLKGFMNNWWGQASFHHNISISALALLLQFTLNASKRSIPWAIC